MIRDHKNFSAQPRHLVFMAAHIVTGALLLLAAWIGVFVVLALLAAGKPI